MFKAPFSFEGRIRRIEYGLSLLVYFVVMITMQVILLNAVEGSSNAGMAVLLVFIVWLPCMYFMFAQGAKRCHDLANSGWFQLIPFYGLWMLFANSQAGINEYGPNPKGVGNDAEFAFEQETIQ